MTSIASVMGLDPSVTCTGVCHGRGEFVTGRVRTKPTTPMVTRMRDISRQVNQTVRDRGVDVVLVEAPIIFSSHPAGLLDIGGLAWVLRTQLDANGVTFVDVAGSQLKKWATGSGGSKKVHVVSAARENLGYQGHDDNEADALFLWHMGCAAYGDPAAEHPRYRLEVLAAITWPTILGHTPTWVLPPKPARKGKTSKEDATLWT